jgi:hypothetical protein
VLKNRRFWIGCLISLFFLFLFFYQVDFGEIGYALAGANYIFILPAVLLLVVIMGMKALRWQYLLKPLGSITLSPVFSVTVIGHMVDSLFPLRIGELVRAYLLGEKERVSKMSTFATIVVARTFDGIALVSVAIIISLFIPLADWLKQIAYIVAVLFFGILAFLLILASSQSRLQKLVIILLRPLSLQWRSKIENWFRLFIRGLKGLQSPKKLCFLFMLSLLIWLLEGFIFYLLAFSFDLSQPFHILLLASTAANLSLLLPSSPGGVGNFEYFCGQTVTIFGVEAAVARAYAIAAHAAVLLPIILLGFCFLWVENLSLAEVIRRPREARIQLEGKGEDGDH